CFISKNAATRRSPSCSASRWARSKPIFIAGVLRSAGTWAMTQDPEDIFELERRVDRALKQLPYPPAPSTLSMRVMRAVSASERTRAAEWPVAVKIAMSAAGFALIVGALLLWPLALDLARTSWQSPGV